MANKLLNKRNADINKSPILHSAPCDNCLTTLDFSRPKANYIPEIL